MSDDDLRIRYNVDLKPLEDLLAGVERAGDFFVNGAVELPLPKVEVEGVGLLSFPVPEAQVAAVIQHAVRAPYGRGEETILDTSVRRVWQLSPDKVRIGGKSWAKSFASILAEVAAGLGCEGKAVSAELYKLLVYDTGGFFLAHRDTEKAEGMFGTLLVVLPSAHRGGELVIRHAGREVWLDMSNTEFSELSFAAFYADCEHEVRPITQGNRVCLVYNLIQQRLAKGRAADLNAPDYDAHITKAAALLEKTLGRDGSTNKIAWLLEHQYSPASLSFAALKSSDAAKARVLVQAAARAGCAVHLGIVHIEESGAAQPSYDNYQPRRGRWGRYDDDEGEDASSDDFEVIEVSDSSQHVDQWVDPKDRPADFGPLPLADGELLPAGALDDEIPDEQRLLEASGNEGASFERAYHRAALVIWHRERYAEVLLQAGVGAVLPYLKERIDSYVGESAASPAREEVVSLARRIMDAWRDARPYASYRQAERSANRAEMLTLLARLGDAALVEEFIVQVVTPGYDGRENAALLSSVRLLGAAKTGGLFATLVGRHMRHHNGGCVELLHGLSAKQAVATEADWASALREVAQAAVAGLDEIARPAAPAQNHYLESERPSQPVQPALVTSLLGALATLGAEPLRERAAAKLSARPEAFDPVTVLVPALGSLRAGVAETARRDGAVHHLWTHSAEFLLKRSELSPDPPKDWRQDARLSCACADCRELQAFVLDPAEQIHRFRVRQDRRQHLQQQIEGHGLDMTHTTDRRGSPQTLVCTKDRRSYQRRCEQYRQDIAAMAALTKLGRSASEECAPLLTRMEGARARAEKWSSV